MATDRRTKYTKGVIRQALIDSLSEKPLAKVTVTDICKRADINRSTFYSYYEDVFDLMNQMQNELFESIAVTLTAENWFEDIIEIVDSNRDLCTILIGPNGDSSFIRQIMYLAYDSSIKLWSEMFPNADTVTMDYAFAYMSNGIIGVLENWVGNKFEPSIDKVGHMVREISMKGLECMK